MGLRINTNVAAMNAYRNLSQTDKAQSTSLERLSSGLRINKAADDAAGLAISEGLRSQISGMKVAARNAQDGVNVAQTADGALGQTTNILQRMRDLAVQASSSGAQGTAAQEAANTEFGQLKQELTRIANGTEFGGQKLLDGSYKGDFQVGANHATDVNQISVDLSSATGALSGDISGFDASGLGLNTAVLAGGADAAANATSAREALSLIDDALAGVNSARASIGAQQNRFEYAIANLNVTVENLSASESAIRDTDMAQEMASFTRNQILSQAGTSMLSQANQAQQNVLSLLR
ncbi:flagellin [Kineococcus sp. NUM-3379]